MITPFYAAILGLGFVALSVRTLRLRRQLKVSLGDGGHDILRRAIRVHANFAEYVPIGLLLIYMAEVEGLFPFLVNLFASCLVLGRFVHAFGVRQVTENFAFRILGMAFTFFSMISSSLYLLLVTFLS